MAWKQSLAKIKQDLKAMEGPEPKASPPPKAPPKKMEEVKPIEDEDALFLSAMGGRSQTKAPKKVSAPDPLPTPVVPVPEAQEAPFDEAMAALKGMKALNPKKVITKVEAPASEAAPVLAIPEPAAPIPEPVAVPPAPGEPRIVSSVPQRIQLAAGMAIEVDGSIDLRGHSIADARERVKERVLDSICLGWRTLQVTLGDAADRRDAFREYLETADPRVIERYAQAPIPMGGASAWILYLGKPGA